MPSFDEVVEALREEFEYSQRWDKDREQNGAPEHRMDRNKPVECWIRWAECELNMAIQKSYGDNDKTAALHNVRKATNLLINAMIHQGCPKR